MHEIKSNTFYLKVLLVVGLMLGIGYLPPFGQITPFGMKILGIFIGCIVGWGFGYIYFTSMIGLLITMYMTDTGFADVFSAAWGNQNLLNVLFSLAFCYGIAETGIVEYITNWVLSRKFATKGLWELSLTFWAAAVATSAILHSSIVVMVLLWTMLYDIVKKLGIPRTDLWVQVTMVIIGIVGYTGCSILPFNGWMMMGYALASGLAPGTELNVFAHIIMITAVNIVLVLALYVLFKYIFGRNIQQVNLDGVITVNHEKMNTKQKVGLFFLIGVIALLILPNILPKNIPGVMALGKLGVAGCFIIVTALMAVVRIDGEPLFNATKAMKNVEWNVVFLACAALYIAGLIPTEATGITPTILTAFKGLTANLGIVGVFVVFLTVGCIATNIMNNVVCVNLFIPIGVLLLISLGGPVNAFVSLMMTILYLGIVLPSGSLIGAMMHGNTEWLEPKSIYLWGTVGCTVAVVVSVIVGVPLALLLF